VTRRANLEQVTSAMRILIATALAMLLSCKSAHADEPVQIPQGQIQELITKEPNRLEPHTNGVGAVAISHDGKMVVSSEASFIARVWNAVDGTEIQKLQVIPTDAEYGYVSALAISLDSNLVATAAWRQPVHFWNPLTGERQEKTFPVRQAAYSLAFSPDGLKLAVGEHAEVKIWDLQSQEVLHRFQFDRRQIGQAWRVTFSPDGTLLAAALLDYGGNFKHKAPKVRLWNVASGEEVFSAWLDRSANAIAISHDGKLAAASGQVVDIWDIETQQLLHRITMDEHIAASLAFAPDGKSILVGTNAPAIMLWNITTGKKIGTIKKHEGQIHFLAFSHDGKTLVSAGGDPAILLWPVALTNVQEPHKHGIERE